MHALHSVVPMFMLIQFFVVLAALVSAMLFADPQATLPAQQASRRERVRATLKRYSPRRGGGAVLQ